MDDIENYCFQLSGSQGMLDLISSRGNYGTVLNLRGVSPSRRTYVATRIIQMTPNGVL